MATAPSTITFSQNPIQKQKRGWRLERHPLLLIRGGGKRLLSQKPFQGFLFTCHCPVLGVTDSHPYFFFLNNSLLSYRLFCLTLILICWFSFGQYVPVSLFPSLYIQSISLYVVPISLVCISQDGPCYAGIINSSNISAA